jgi:hypothetical protein
VSSWWEDFTASLSDRLLEKLDPVTLLQGEVDSITVLVET